MRRTAAGHRCYGLLSLHLPRPPRGDVCRRCLAGHVRLFMARASAGAAKPRFDRGSVRAVEGAACAMLPWLCGSAQASSPSAAAQIAVLHTQTHTRAHTYPNTRTAILTVVPHTASTFGQHRCCLLPYGNTAQGMHTVRQRRADPLRPAVGVGRGDVRACAPAAPSRPGRQQAAYTDLSRTCNRQRTRGTRRTAPGRGRQLRAVRCPATCARHELARRPTRRLHPTVAMRSSPTSAMVTVTQFTPVCFAALAHTIKREACIYRAAHWRSYLAQVISISLSRHWHPTSMISPSRVRSAVSGWTNHGSRDRC